MIQLFGGLGATLLLISQIWLAVLAFRKSIVWGLLVLCVPCAAFVFIIMNWSETKVPALIYIIGWLLGGGYSGYQYQNGRGLGTGRVFTASR